MLGVVVFWSIVLPTVGAGLWYFWKNVPHEPKKVRRTGVSRSKKK